MKKGIYCGLGVLFIVAILISGCSKSEEKKTEAPAVHKQTVQEKAPAVKQEMVEHEMAEEGMAEEVEPTDESATMTEQAVEAAKEMGKQALESEIEKLPEEAQQAVDVAKQYSSKSGGEQVEQTATEATPSLEQSLKEKAAEQGMELPSKH